MNYGPPSVFRYRPLIRKIHQLSSYTSSFSLSLIISHARFFERTFNFSFSSVPSRFLPNSAVNFRSINLGVPQRDNPGNPKTEKKQNKSRETLLATVTFARCSPSIEMYFIASCPHVVYVYLVNSGVGEIKRLLSQRWQFSSTGIYMCIYWQLLGEFSRAARSLWGSLRSREYPPL